MSHEQLNITELKKDLREFAKKRNWEQFHAPKNLAMAVSVEVAELVELFQWSTIEESWDLAKDEDKKGQISDEIADIMLYLTRLSDLLDIDVVKAIQNKYVKNEKKYPPKKCWGSSKKYDELG